MSIWLRHETKDNEKRTLLTPEQVIKLVAKGYEVCVEKSETRVYPDQAYENTGARLVNAGSWKDAPKNYFILGLKELPEASFNLIHKHIYFAHVFKEQDGYKETLTRYINGGGELFDLEYLVNEKGRRIAAFGRWAGFVGTALAIDAYLYKKLNSKDYPALYSFNDSNELINQIKAKLEKTTDRPKPIVIGHKGRCGSGAIDVITRLGLESSLWDAERTKPGGPFKEILDHHIFINTALIQKKIPPFIDETILDKDQALSIIADVGCDPTSELNPVPLYSRISSFEKPFINYTNGEVSIDILAVDNLPTILPKESSEDFSQQFFPHLMNLLEIGVHEPVWKSASNVFQNAISKIK